MKFKRKYVNRLLKVSKQMKYEEGMVFKDTKEFYDYYSKFL